MGSKGVWNYSRGDIEEVKALGYDVPFRLV